MIKEAADVDIIEAIKIKKKKETQISFFLLVSKKIEKENANRFKKH
jgi:hypothetical protein